MTTDCNDDDNDNDDDDDDDDDVVISIDVGNKGNLLHEVDGDRVTELSSIMVGSLRLLEIWYSVDPYLRASSSRLCRRRCSLSLCSRSFADRRR